MGDMVFNSGYAASTIFPSAELKTFEEVGTWVDRRLMVLFAGAMAEALNGNNVEVDAAHGILRTTAKNDYGKIREYLRLLRNMNFSIGTEAEMNEQLERLYFTIGEKSADLVRKYRGQIKELVGEILPTLTEKGGGTFTKQRIEALPFIQKLKPHS